MKIEMPRLSDYHVHGRQFPKLADIVPQSARYCGRMLVMPNLTPPVLTAADAVAYHRSVSQFAGAHVDVLATLKLTGATTPDVVRACREFPQIAGFKLYPAGVTTHSADGIPADVIDAPQGHTWFGDVLDVMQREKLVLCLHGEHPREDDPFLREPAFHLFVGWVVANFPKLRVVMEHITTRESVDFVRRLTKAGCNLGATITAHHLMLHFGHLCGTAASADESRYRCGDGKLHPHAFCMPVLKRSPDRAALVRAATSGEPWFFLGSDSAPHPVDQKEAACGCAGVFSAPVLPEALAQVFADHGEVDKLAGFVAHSGDRFYGRETVDAPPVRVVNRRWTVPERVCGFVPFMAGCDLDWRMESASY